MVVRVIVRYSFTTPWPVVEAAIKRFCEPMPAVNDDSFFVPSGDRL
jgi:hypothetical protein